MLFSQRLVVRLLLEEGVLAHLLDLLRLLHIARDALLDLRALLHHALAVLLALERNRLLPLALGELHLLHALLDLRLLLREDALRLQPVLLLLAQALLLAVARLDLREALLALALDAQRALALKHLARDLEPPLLLRVLHRLLLELLRAPLLGDLARALLLRALARSSLRFSSSSRRSRSSWISCIFISKPSICSSSFSWRLRILCMRFSSISTKVAFCFACCARIWPGVMPPEPAPPSHPRACARAASRGGGERVTAPSVCARRAKHGAVSLSRRRARARARARSSRSRARASLARLEVDELLALAAHEPHHLEAALRVRLVAHALDHRVEALLGERVERPDAERLGADAVAEARPPPSAA